MSRKKRARKPPIDKKKIAKRLDRALKQKLLVRIRRWIPDADRIDGYVVGVGARWVALADLSDEMHLDGWTFIRLKDIQAVDLDPDVECFPTRAVRLRGQWPPTNPCPDVAVLDDVVSLVTTVRDLSPLVTVHREFSRPDACWIGAVTDIDERRLWLHQVDPDAEWGRKLRQKDLDDLTRIQVGGAYEEARALVAGPRPASD